MRPNDPRERSSSVRTASVIGIGNGLWTILLFLAVFGTESSCGGAPPAQSCGSALGLFGLWIASQLLLGVPTFWAGQLLWYERSVGRISGLGELGLLGVAITIGGWALLLGLLIFVR